jgi:carboxyl-terminal processing protease
MIRIFFLPAVLVVGALAQTPDSALPAETRAWVTAKLYASIQAYFAHTEGAPAFQLDRDFRVYLKAAMEAPDRYAFDMATVAFVSKLRNGHTGFSDAWLYRNYGQSLGFTLLPMAEGWVVTSSRLPAIDPGDVVVSVSGKPIEQFYAEHEPLLTGSSDTSRRRTFSGHTWVWPLQFDLDLAGGKHVAINRKTQKLERVRTFPYPQGPVQTPDGVGFIRIQSFDDPKFENAALRQVKELRNAKAIIIDVRGNGGGSTPGHLIEALLDRQWQDFRFTTPLRISHAGAQNQVRVLVPNQEADQYLKGYLDAYEEFKDTQLVTPGPLHPPAPDAYKGKVILLVDGFCGSACEDFVEPFKTSGRGVVLGQATIGSSGQPYLFEFGNGMSFRVSSKRYYLPDGSPFEGVGLKPDVEVVPSLEDSKAGRDPVLAKALQLASQN